MKNRRNHQSISAENALAYFIISGLYFKPMAIINDDSRVIIKLEASLTGDARVIIYDRHMFIVQATDLLLNSL